MWSQSLILDESLWRVYDIVRLQSLIDLDACNLKLHRNSILNNKTKYRTPLHRKWISLVKTQNSFQFSIKIRIWSLFIFTTFTKSNKLFTTKHLNQKYKNTTEPNWKKEIRQALKKRKKKQKQKMPRARAFARVAARASSRALSENCAAGRVEPSDSACLCLALDYFRVGPRKPVAASSTRRKAPTTRGRWC